MCMVPWYHASANTAPRVTLVERKQIGARFEKNLLKVLTGSAGHSHQKGEMK